MIARIRRPHVLALGGVLVLAFVLRAWGAKWGLPFAYQTDEERLYVHHAVQMLNRDHINPHYFQNPPLYSYALEAIFAVLYGAGKAGRMIGEVPARGELYLVARVFTAAIGTFGVWLVYIATRRLFDPVAGLVAALVMAVAFLPVFYSHTALNNVPAMVAATGALVGIAGVLRYGRRRDFIVAGVGIGVAAATKYTAGAMAVPLITAAFVAPNLKGMPGGWRGPLRGLCWGLGAALVVFLICNPQAILSNEHFQAALKTQGRLVGDEKYGQDPNGGIPFYLGSFTWGLGILPVLAALGGLIPLCRRHPRVALVLVPIVPLFIFYLGSETRYFARWMLPIFPVVCILAGYGASVLVEEIRRKRPVGAFARIAIPAVVGLALAAQGLIYTVHNDRVLSRPHTLDVARTWMIDNIPQSAGVITEPIRADSWNWYWPRGRSSIQDGYDPRSYLEGLDQGTVYQYLIHGYCWVQTSSNYWGPALKYPDQAPDAATYWQALNNVGTVVYSNSPWDPIDTRRNPGDDEVPFDYDYSYDFYPLSFERPGPAVLVYRLHGGECGPPKVPSTS